MRARLLIGDGNGGRFKAGEEGEATKIANPKYDYEVYLGDVMVRLPFSKKEEKFERRFYFHHSEVEILGGQANESEAMANGEVKVKMGDETFAVLVRSCSISGAIDTSLFWDVDAAMVYCNVVWNIPKDKWDAYMVSPDPTSSIRLNGQGVRYCGWKYDVDETETLHIHLNRKIIEF